MKITQKQQIETIETAMNKFMLKHEDEWKHDDIVFECPLARFTIDKFQESPITLSANWLGELEK